VDEIEHFFISYNQMEGRQFRPLARHGPDYAQELLEKEREGLALGITEPDALETGARNEEQSAAFGRSAS